MILNDKDTYGILRGDAVTYLMHHNDKAYGTDFMLSGDGPANFHSRQLMEYGIYRDDWVSTVRSFYERTTIDMIHEHACRLGDDWEIDIIRDVGNTAQVHFAAEVFSLPLKTKKNKLNPFTEYELYDIMAMVCICIFFGNLDTAKQMQLRQFAHILTQELGDIMEHRLQPLSSDWHLSNALREEIRRSHGHSPVSTYGEHMIIQLLQAEPKLSIKDIVWSHLLETAGGTVAIQGQLFAQVIDFYLREENVHHWRTIQSLARQESHESERQLRMYMLEAARINSSMSLPRKVQKDVTVRDGAETHHLKEGDVLVVNLVACSHDPAKFPKPESIDINRPEADYIFYGWGPHQCLGMQVSKTALTTMLRIVARLHGLRRAPGAPGQLKTMRTSRGFAQYLTPDGSQMFPFPTTMRLRWDGGLPHRIDNDEEEL